MTTPWRLTPLLALSGAVLLLLAGVAVGIYGQQQYRTQKVDEARVQAGIVAAAVSAALAFDDAATASNYVEALAANPAIEAAGVYDARGRLFASFRRGETHSLPTSVAAGTTSYGKNEVEVAVAVVQKDARLGTVFLRARTESVTQRAIRYIGFVLLGVMALLMLGVLGVAQAALNRANAELRAHAAELERANSQLRDQVAERRKAEEALRQAQKMESIGQLTGGVAHDFNNLLAIILGNLERAERRLAQGAEPGAIRQTIVNARHGAERAATLTRSLLAFSRRQPMRPQPVEVNRLVSGMSQILLRTLGEQVTVETVVSGGLWRTSVDPNQLESVILNLALNARDAMPEGGKLTIETANAYLDERYAAEIEELEPGQYVQVAVSDTGRGMSPEVIEHAFEPFFTTKEAGHGTGLGLSQVYGIVKQSGGHVKIYSEPGAGTTIKIYLPRLVGGEEPETQTAAIPSTPAEAPAAAGTVLVVEDEEGVREHSVSILTELGYRVLAARDGASALRLLGENDDVALLFTDVGLPGGMNGRQLAEEARRRRSDLQVLYTTAYARNAIVHDGRLDPGVRLVTKPFTFAELSEAVRRALAPPRPAVLIVEDEALVRLDLVEQLREFGCEALEAGTAAEAESVVRRRQGRLAAVLLDLGLPDAQGDGLTASLRAAWPDLPLIVSSGSSADSLRPELASDPKVSFLPKPYERTRLEGALRSVGVPVETPASTSSRVR